MPRKLTGQPNGRPPKKLGPATVAAVKAGAKNDNVRNMWPSNPQSEQSLLRPAQEPDATPDEEVKVFDTAGVQDTGRPSGFAALAADGEQRISILVKRILMEVAAPVHQDGGSKRTNAEALTRLLVSKALEGSQFAIDAVLDRAEGKPVKGVTVSTPDMSLEELLDQQEVALLNNLLKKE